MKKIEAKTPTVETSAEMSFAVIDNLTGADIGKLAQERIVKVVKTIETTTEKLGEVKDKLVGTMHETAMIVASMKRRHQEAIYKREIPADTSFNGKKKRSYFAQHAGGFCPPRIEAMAAFFNSTVLTLDANGKPLLTEENFRAANVAWLEKAIIGFEMDESADWKTSDNTLDCLNALSKTGDAMEKLKAIQKIQQGGDDVPPPVETAPLTLGMAVEFIKAMFANAANVKADDQVPLVAALFELNDAWANNDLTENRRNALDKQVTEALENNIPVGLKITRGEALAAA